MSERSFRHGCPTPPGRPGRKRAKRARMDCRSARLQSSVEGVQLELQRAVRLALEDVRRDSADVLVAGLGRPFGRREGLGLGPADRDRLELVALDPVREQPGGELLY